VVWELFVWGLDFWAESGSAKTYEKGGHGYLDPWKRGTPNPIYTTSDTRNIFSESSLLDIYQTVSKQ